jgi:hypothetical protein
LPAYRAQATSERGFAEARNEWIPERNVDERSARICLNQAENAEYRADSRSDERPFDDRADDRRMCRIGSTLPRSTE